MATSLFNHVLVLLSSLFIGTHIACSRKPPKDDDNKCELVGTFSLLTQALLGLLCLLSLIAKRFYEYPIRRTWPVWFFDVSKQVIGAMGVHVFNVLLSILKALSSELTSRGGLLDDCEDGDCGDPCDWYFLSIVLDCTIGVYVLYVVLYYVSHVCKTYLHMTQTESGQYGPDPNKPSVLAYAKQLGIYFGSLMITKFILYGFVECFESELVWITSHILLAWLDEYPNEFEIFIVMFVVPIFMNCLQLILVDNFIQNQVVHLANVRSYRHRHPEGEAEALIKDNDEERNYRAAE